MANLSKTFALFGFTSPRTVEKIVPEIRLLIDEFDGQEWNKDTQRLYFAQLSKSDFYEDSKTTTEPDLAARDRITRAPKALGFVSLKPVISLTDAGVALLALDDTAEVLTRQLLKFQLPSPYHTDSSGRFWVKPYLELLRLTSELGGLTKDEVALFFTRMLDYRDFERIKADVIDFRDRMRNWTGNRNQLIQAEYGVTIRLLYSDMLATQSYQTRQSATVTPEKFISTKKSNLRDYADAFIRYLRATLLVTVDRRTFRIRVSDYQREAVDFILANVERDPFMSTSTTEYQDYLFNSTLPPLFSDQRAPLVRKLAQLAPERSSEFGRLDIPHLKRLFAGLSKDREKTARQESERKLANFSDFESVEEVFESIAKREVYDPALFFEWNVWRAMVMLNDAITITGNFRTDFDGIPLSHAPGNAADIECEYAEFCLIVEVTTSRGNRQYEMEGEPVPRHLGDARLTSSKPVFCIFIAPTISEGALAHFFVLNLTSIKRYGGKSAIIPLEIQLFRRFVEKAKQQSVTDSNKLHTFLKGIISSVDDSNDETEWYKLIQNRVDSWV